MQFSEFLGYTSDIRDTNELRLTKKIKIGSAAGRTDCKERCDDIKAYSSVVSTAASASLIISSSSSCEISSASQQPHSHSSSRPLTSL